VNYEAEGAFRVAGFSSGDTLAVIVIVAACVALPLISLVLKYHWNWRLRRRRYVSMQATRASLSDEVFCRQAGFDAPLVSVVQPIRPTLASFGGYDPLRIYPEDSFGAQFRLGYDDDVAFVVQNMKIIKGYNDYSFPLEEVDTVADFVRAVWRLKKDAELDGAA
jgi:hypothetical protein